jgi:hypothetical protein
MTIRSTAGFAAVAMLFGTLACAGNSAGGEDETAAARDTSGVQNPSGYRGMERDTSLVPPDSQPEAVDTFLREQGTGVPEDTAGYSGLEHPDTSMTAGEDTSGAGWSDTSGASGMDKSGMSGTSDTGQTGWDSSQPQ